ncbi:Pyruvate phosphate dikinase, PEP/pyruvate binding domain [Andreprevotia lacus DSM 23236]|jgi:phosphohistidine swiveling domain-containing protein|uniref:Pyruvate phosphate dikinase, PEP/pyruvate binding domain n=1 Tax=Andreprevotia lacus DSM 23236 TaxID=1121001 RepID=A0A1W1XHX2_9NEIS|nr:PEP/pyruvate-binding domain-containing protein [Andreprevotia lacus]SMC23427.1 Pyruvate phosphate dikinase, PEP/pyruvate binding domain [Andreprevotia lacus DSM 23236]
MQFLSKARTLEALQPVLRSARLLPQRLFDVARWQTDADALLAEIRAARWPEMAVRSSAQAEDSAAGSLAGRFESVLHVVPDDLPQAIETVLASMREADGSINPANEVFVQPMLARVQMAGVAFGLDPATGAPYYVLNYDDSSSRTDSVTAGQSNQLKTFYIHHLAPPQSGLLAGVVAMIAELGEVFGTAALDIEFAVTDGGELVLLQVRPLLLAAPEVEAAGHYRMLEHISAKIGQGVRPQPFLHGRRTVYGVMPDWNPAEIIGVRPKPLSLSLYRELVTDSIWAYQRHNYGYRNLRSFPLMLHFHGLPYIDVRVSFNSFVPRDIDGSLADKLVNYYVDRLLAAPNLHDKVEFEIVFSCYTLDLPQRLEKLAEAGFTEAERQRLADSLRNLTNRIVDNETGLWRSDRDKLAVLAARRDEILAADIDRVTRIYWLLEDCKRYGTLPFAGLARAGFIAVQMLRSLVSVGVLDRANYDAFMNGLDTVSGQMTRDLVQLDRTTFLAKYGHLRPGTYDLLSPRYDEAPDLYFDWQRQVAEHTPTSPFALSLAQMRAISKLLAEHGLTHDVVGLFDFLQAGIELREYAKFVFCRNLSDAMSLFRELGREHGFSLEDMAYADIQCVYELHAAGVDPVALIGESIARGRKRYAETCQIVLPPLLTRAEDAFAFEMPATEPNFITQRQVTAPVVSYKDRDHLVGAIVAIPSADPGFDWLFSHDIAGFITAYGGVNSHMAIRANELGLPAVIGSGEVLYGKWSAARMLNIDCANRRVEVLR